MSFILSLIGSILVFLTFYLWLNSASYLTLISQLLIDASLLDITSIEISEPAEDGFALSVKCSLSNAGPVPVIVTQLHVEMAAEKQGRVFCRSLLPDIQVENGRGDAHLTKQRVLVQDTAAFDVFCGNLLSQKELPLYLTASPRLSISLIPSLLPSIQVDGVKVNKLVMLRGMNTLSISVLSTRTDPSSKNPKNIQVDVSIHNRSIVTIDMGKVEVDLVIDSTALSTLSAAVTLVPGATQVTFNGVLNLKKVLSKPSVGLQFLKREVREEPSHGWVIGRHGQAGWCDSVVKKMRSPVTVDSTLKDIYQSM